MSPRDKTLNSDFTPSLVNTKSIEGSSLKALRGKACAYEPTKAIGIDRLSLMYVLSLTAPLILTTPALTFCP